MLAVASDLANNEHSVARRYPRPVEQPPIGELLLEVDALVADGALETSNWRPQNAG